MLGIIFNLYDLGSTTWCSLWNIHFPTDVRRCCFNISTWFLSLWCDLLFWGHHSTWSKNTHTIWIYLTVQLIYTVAGIVLLKQTCLTPPPFSKPNNGYLDHKNYNLLFYVVRYWLLSHWVTVELTLVEY